MNLLTWLQTPGTASTLTDAAKTIADNRQTYVIALIGLTGTLIPVILSWFKDRGIDTQRTRQLDEGVKRIAFWEQWLKLSTALGGDTATLAQQRVRQELDLLCSALSNSSAQIHSEDSALKRQKVEFKSKLSNLSLLKRALLLYHPPRPLAWVPRFFFYLFSLLTVIGMLFELSSLMGSTAQDKEDISNFLAFSIFTFIVAIVFRYLSILIETPRKTKTEVTTDLPPRPLN